MSLSKPYVEGVLDLSTPKRDQITPAVFDSPLLGSTSLTHLNYECEQCNVPVVQHYVPGVQTYGEYREYSARYSRLLPNPALPSPESMEPQVCDTESLLDDAEYIKFEKDALRVLTEVNGGKLIVHNPKMKRTTQTNEAADGVYRTQRQINNIAVKQSRERKKMSDIRLSIQSTYLKKKVRELKAMMTTNFCSHCHQRLIDEDN